MFQVKTGDAYGGYQEHFYDINHGDKGYKPEPQYAPEPYKPEPYKPAPVYSPN